MDHISDLIHHFVQVQTSTKPGIISMITCCLSAIFAFTTTFITLKDVQTVAALIASLVAIVSGGFAIYFYRLQIKKINKNV